MISTSLRRLRLPTRRSSIFLKPSGIDAPAPVATGHIRSGHADRWGNRVRWPAPQAHLAWPARRARTAGTNSIGITITVRVESSKAASSSATASSSVCVSRCLMTRCTRSSSQPCGKSLEFLISPSFSGAPGPRFAANDTEFNPRTLVTILIVANEYAMVLACPFQK